VAPAQSEAASEAALVAPDESLAPDGYVERGLPPLSETWTPDQYRTAAEVLSALPSRTQLPRKYSAASRDVFLRVAATENLERLTAKTESVSARLDTAQRYLNSIAPLLALYHQPIADGGGFPSEQVDLVGLLFNLAEHARALSRERLEGAAATAKAEEERRFLAVSTLGAGFVQGALTMLAEGEKYPEADQRRLSTLVAEFAPGLWPDLTSAVQERLKAGLADSRSKTPSAAVKKTLTDLDAQLVVVRAGAPESAAPSSSAPLPAAPSKPAQ
jgi:hypothetical protein